MKLHTKILGALAIAFGMVAAPMSASAITIVDINDGDVLSVQNGAQLFSFQQEFDANELPAVLTFEFVNDTGDTIHLRAGQPADITPNGSITPATFAFSGQSAADLEQNDIFTLLGAGDSTILTVSLGGGTGGLVQVAVSAVPLPASVLLFGSALAGLGLLGRRRKVAAA